MKWLLLVLMLICYTVNAQDIPKGANAIIVKGVTFKEVVNRLLDSNYTIAKIDSNFLTVETAPTAVHVGTMIIRARIKDSIAIITGIYRMGEKTDNRQGTIAWLMAGNDYPIANAGLIMKKKNSPFAIMSRFALSFSKPVEYKTL